MKRTADGAIGERHPGKQAHAAARLAAGVRLPACNLLCTLQPIAVCQMNRIRPSWIA
jgi:hypothetical protein